ncbi:MAG: glycoside hydrolase family 3 protein [Micrococcales bacterium]|nr:glycoside hydrolase family 3 protein [Micrococcales bacterium]
MRCRLWSPRRRSRRGRRRVPLRSGERRGCAVGAARRGRSRRLQLSSVGFPLWRAGPAPSRESAGLRHSIRRAAPARCGSLTVVSRGPVALSGRAAAVLLPGFVGTKLPEWLGERLSEGLAGVCLFGENIVDAEQLRRLTDAIRAANPHAVIAVDEEGGDVTRLHHATGSPDPGNAILGRIDDVELTASVAASVARELRAAGITLNFAPDVDVNANPDNPVIGVRSFGADARRVAAHAAAWVAAHEAEGVATSAKHFPGHGDTAQDSHLALPSVDVDAEELDRRELPPFAAAIAAGARTVMSSHIRVPALDELPATFSAPILQGLLRDRMGFTGAIVSDALDMAGASGTLGIPAAAVAALRGGCDLLCIGTRTTDEQLLVIAGAIEAAVLRGELAAERLADAGARVRALAASAASPAVPMAPHEVDLDRVRGAFEIAPGLVVPTGATVVAIETTPNIAVGPTPWGLAAAGAEVVEVRERDTLPAEGPWIIVGRANHRHRWVRELADEARRRHPGTLVIDMGWPSPDRAYADIATFGAARIVGEALRDLLGLPPRSTL